VTVLDVNTKKEEVASKMQTNAVIIAVVCFDFFIGFKDVRIFLFSDIFFFLPYFYGSNIATVTT